MRERAGGSGAVAFGGYLRAHALIPVPATITIHQGYDMGRPSLLTVTVPPTGGISVTGTAAPLPA